MIQFKYYKSGAQFDSSSLSPEDIAFVESTSSLYTHDKQYKFVTDDVAKLSDILTIHANDATATDVANLSGTTASIDINNFINAALLVAGAENVNATVNGSVVSITDRNGNTKSVDLASITDERVVISVSSDVTGVDVEGLVINIYYNNATTPSKLINTDENGMCAFRVPNGYKYKIVFPSIAGCVTPEDIIHTATINQRAIEVEYVEPDEAGEDVDILVKQYTSVSSGTVAPNITVNVTSNGTTTQYTTNSDGRVQFTIPYGVEYTISTVAPEGYYIDNRRSTITRTAQKSSYFLLVRLYPYQSGIFIMTDGGDEYSFDEWKAAVDAGSESNENAKFIKVASAILCENSGVFYVEIDALRDRSYLQKQWMTANNNLPELGYNTYSYNGLTATEKILEEAGTLGYTVPAATEAYSKKYTIDGNILQGFLGGLGQMEQFWGVRESIDEILIYTRPNGSYLLSTFTSNKWASTQSNTNHARSWTNSASDGHKTDSLVVVPFFAF